MCVCVDMYMCIYMIVPRKYISAHIATIDIPTKHMHTHTHTQISTIDIPTKHMHTHTQISTIQHTPNKHKHVHTHTHTRAHTITHTYTLCTHTHTHTHTLYSQPRPQTHSRKDAPSIRGAPESVADCHSADVHFLWQPTGVTVKYVLSTQLSEC